jgi:Holliday junction resolvase RusA-like endonuclease
MASVEFTITGVPIPNARPRLSRKGRFTNIYSPTTEYKTQIALVSNKLFVQGNYFDEAVEISIKYYFPRPKTHYGTGKNKGTIKANYQDVEHIVKPDLDNLNKAVFDAVTNGGLWKDDSLVCKQSSNKQYIQHYGETPRTNVIIKDRK